MRSGRLLPRGASDRSPVAVTHMLASPLGSLREFFASVLALIDQDEPLLCQCDIATISPECSSAARGVVAT
jgi:hypothetical protein